MTHPHEGVIGIDIGGTNLRGALVRTDGTVIDRFRTVSAIHEGRVPFLARLLGGVQLLRQKAHEVDMVVRALGVGVPGLIDRHGVVHSSVNMPVLQGLGLREYLEAQLGLPVRCANDANLIALGEAYYGTGQGLDSLVVVTIGTGVGSGLILNGKLWEGVRGFASEFGHLTVEPDGLPCPCGNRGCLEQYVSATAISKNGGGRSSEQLACLARGGDADAQRLFDAAAEYLGIGLAGLLNLLNLDGIVIGGGVAASYDLLEPVLLRTLEQRTFPQIMAGVELRRAALGDDAGLLGAALMALEAVGLHSHI